MLLLILGGGKNFTERPVRRRPPKRRGDPGVSETENEPQWVSVLFVPHYRTRICYTSSDETDDFGLLGGLWNVFKESERDGVKGGGILPVLVTFSDYLNTTLNLL